MNLRMLTSPSLKKVGVILVIQALLLCMFIKFYSNANRKTRSVKEQDLIKISARHTSVPVTPAIPPVISASNRRVAYLRQHCRERKDQLTSSYPFYDEDKWLHTLTKWIWMVSPHHHLFYCATPKCGSTTWKSYIMEDLKINWTGSDTHE